MFNSQLLRRATAGLVTLSFVGSVTARAEETPIEEQVVREKSSLGVGDVATSGPEGFQENPYAPKKKRSKASKDGEPGAAPVEVSDSDYVGAAVRAAYEQKLQEMKRAEEVERHEASVRAAAERRKVETAENVERHLRDAHEYRVKSERAQETVEMLQAEVQNEQRREKVAVEEYAVQEKAAKEILQRQNEYREQAAEAVRRAERAERGLAEVQRMVHKASVEAQKYQAEISRAESEIAVIENDRQMAEAKYLDTQSDVLALKTRNKDLALRRKALMSEIADLNKRLNATRNEFFAQRRESERLEKEVHDYERRAAYEIAAAHGEIKKYEEQTAKLATARLRDEAERDHLKEKIEIAKADLMAAKKKHSKAMAESDAASALVIESRYALQQQKAELAREYAGFERDVQSREHERSKVRTLASMAEASDMLDGQKASRLSRNCSVHGGPATQSPVVGRLKQGSKVISWPADAGWSKIMNSSGAPQYVDSSCLEDL